MHLHLQTLEDDGLVTSKFELSRDGKALNYFEVTEFAFHLTPAAVADAARTLTAKPEAWRIPMSANTTAIFYRWNSARPSRARAAGGERYIGAAADERA